MANFKDSPHFSVHNDYYTPKSAWEDIWKIIKDKVMDKVIWEAFMLNSNGQSKKYLTETYTECTVVGDKTWDFFEKSEEEEFEYDLVMSNPPFERIRSYKSRKENLKYRCIEKLFKNGKPFIILLNSTNIFQRWFQTLTQYYQDEIFFIFPSRKIQYDKYEVGGEVALPTQKEYLEEIGKPVGDLTTEEREKYEKLNGGSASFNTIYLTWKVLDHNEWISY